MLCLKRVTRDAVCPMSVAHSLVGGSCVLADWPPHSGADGCGWTSDGPRKTTAHQGFHGTVVCQHVLHW
eukprot:scaffold48423_cov14-Tisochrysis_lutea.AAC.1